MQKYCDLHTHSYFSDGTYSPARLVRRAEEIGLGAIALCDHNTVAGLPEFMEAGRGSPVQTVPGIEFSTDYQGRELHIAALLVQPQYYEAITEKMEEGRKAKEQSNRELVCALARAGYPVDYDRIRESAKGRINRAHIAAALTQAGYTASVQEAFQTLLSPKHGFYHPPKLPDALEIIRYIRKIGAVSVFAHPFLSLKTPQRVRAFLQEAVAAGLDAMEVYYSKFDEEQTQAANRLAEEFGLLMSGGSDFHGENKPDIQLGWGRGALKIPMEFLDKITAKNQKLCK